MKNDHLLEKATSMKGIRGDGGDLAEESDGCSGDDAEALEAQFDELLDRYRRMVTEGLSRTRTNRTLNSLSRMRARIDSLMCDVSREAAASDPDVEPVELLRREARLGGREAKRLGRIATRLADLPTVAEKFAAGDITLSHVHSLVNVAEKLGPETVEAATDLLDAAEELLPDSFDRRARDTTNQKLIEAGVPLAERRRQERAAGVWLDRQTGMGILWAKLPPDVFAHIRQAVDGRYLELLGRDGADGRAPESVRTSRQRMADVVYELLTNRDAKTGNFLENQGAVRAKASTQLILGVPLGLGDGTDPEAVINMIGTGPVPREILRTLSPDTELAGMIFDRAGRPLWLGRNQRLGNAPQRLAVAIRDGGCFECGAPMHRCDLHHIRPWREGGRTDIDNLVAVCRRHHRLLEAENASVQWVEDRWRMQTSDRIPG